MKSKSPHDEPWGKLVGISLALMAVATVYLVLVLGLSVRLVDGGGPWFVTGHVLENGELFDATRNAVAFATFTIAGGAAYLAYRRQRATDRTNALTSSRHERDELGELHARFTAAVEQLAHSSATVRIAGVYSLAAVADQWLVNDDLEQAQVAVDVLCGYMRIPYSPGLGANHQTKRVVKSEKSEPGETTEEHFEFPQNDRVVRQTICAVIGSKLRGLPLLRKTVRLGVVYIDPVSKTATGPWSKLLFDFSGAHLVDADFEACRFDQPVKFVETVFAGRANFEGTHFDKTAAFDQAIFQGTAIFSRSRGSLPISFAFTKFKGPSLFPGVHFDDLSLYNTKFAASADFRGATIVAPFTAQRVFAKEWNFSGATFQRGAYFIDCTAGASVTFAKATITEPLYLEDTATPSTKVKSRTVAWDSPDQDGADFSDVEWLPVPADETPDASAELDPVE
ncbi:pentapeptide repeat-containing protein [Rhodococcus hoagii]|uniref:pentapeptide repeat-containing protein n=1 Tax=Rhodococcus hoagii TaxID=43767 RepID=UPI00196548D3|nr:pentapeptide repeat-containing protein [Prescottella equi]MBM9838702.1 pentapeptide repeat-containing protein [Prescottella equi]